MQLATFLAILKVLGKLGLLFGICVFKAACLGFVTEALLALYQYNEGIFWKYLAMSSTCFLLLQYPLYKFRAHTMLIHPVYRPHIEVCMLEGMLVAGLCQLLIVYTVLGISSSYFMMIVWSSVALGVIITVTMFGLGLVTVLPQSSH